MKSAFKKFLTLVLILTVTFSTSSCYSSYDNEWGNTYNSDYYDSSWDETTSDTYSENNYSYYNHSDFVSSYSAPSSSYSSSVVSSSIEEHAYPKVYNLVELRDLLKENFDKNNLSVNFEFLGSESFDASEIARMTPACHVRYVKKEKKYTLTMTQCPGDRIVDAYFSGDSSKLNKNEIKALDKAIEIVNQAKASSTDQIDLELYLHDYICKTVTYDDHTRYIEDPMNPPRNLTAVGGLLDGRANCQGYSDTFYVLASIAGFKVDRLSVNTPNDHHTVSTIYLGGQWLIVDTTFDDSEAYNNETISYRFFNASKDVITEYSWPEHYETNQIATETTEYFYYRCYNYCYDNAAEMATDLVQKYEDSTTQLHGILESEETLEQVIAALNDAFIASGRSVPSYHYRFRYDGNFYYYQFLF